MPSYFKLIQKIYLEHPDVTPSELWMTLCREFNASQKADNALEEKAHHKLFPRLPAYAALANEFANSNALYTASDQSHDATTLMMMKINDAIKHNSLLFDNKDPFILLLKAFLTCQPDFEEVFDKTLRDKLNIKAYIPYLILEDRLQRNLEFIPNQQIYRETEMPKIEEMHLLFDLFDLKENESLLLNNLIIRITRVNLVTASVLKLNADFWDKISDRTIQKVAHTLAALLDHSDTRVHDVGISALKIIFPRLNQNTIQRMSTGVMKSLLYLVQERYQYNDYNEAAAEAAKLIITLLSRLKKEDRNKAIHSRCEAYERYANDTTSDATILFSSLTEFKKHRIENRVRIELIEGILYQADSALPNEIVLNFITQAELEQKNSIDETKHSPSRNYFEASKHKLENYIKQMEGSSTAPTEVSQNQEAKNAETQAANRFQRTQICNDIVRKNAFIPIETKNAFLDLLISNMYQGKLSSEHTSYMDLRTLVNDQLNAKLVSSEKAIVIAQQIKQNISEVYARQDAIMALYSEIYRIYSVMLQQFSDSQSSLSNSEFLKNIPVENIPEVVPPSYVQSDCFRLTSSTVNILANIVNYIPLDLFKSIVNDIMSHKTITIALSESKEDGENTTSVSNKVFNKIDQQIKQLDFRLEFLKSVFINPIVLSVTSRDYDKSQGELIQFILQCLLKLSPLDKPAEETLQPLFTYLADNQHLTSENIESIGQWHALYLKHTNPFPTSFITIAKLSSQLSENLRLAIIDTIFTSFSDTYSIPIEAAMDRHLCLMKLLQDISNKNLGSIIPQLLDKIDKISLLMNDKKFKLQDITNLFLRLKNPELVIVIDRLTNILNQSDNKLNRELAFNLLFSLSQHLPSVTVRSMINYVFWLETYISSDILTKIQMLILQPAFYNRLDDASLKKIMDYIQGDLPRLFSHEEFRPLLIKLYDLVPLTLLNNLDSQSNKETNYSHTLEAMHVYFALVSQNKIPLETTNEEEKSPTPHALVLEHLITKLISDLEKSDNNRKNAIFTSIVNSLSLFPDKIFETQPYKKLLDKVFEAPGIPFTYSPPGHGINTEILHRIPEDKAIALFHHHVNAIPVIISAIENEPVQYPRLGYGEKRKPLVFDQVVFAVLYQRVPEAMRMSAINKLLEKHIEAITPPSYFRQNYLIALIGSLSPNKQNYYLFAVLPQKLNKSDLSAAVQTALLSWVKEVTTERVLQHEIKNKVTSAPSILLDYLVKRS